MSDSKKVKVVNTSGKRKTAVARASTMKGKGRIRINKVPLEIYQPEIPRLKIMEALKIAGKRVETLDINISATGGGIMGQAEAIRTAVARGIVEYYEKYHKDMEIKDVYLHYDRSMLVNDTRTKESKHPMGRGARKKRQKSYR